MIDPVLSRPIMNDVVSPRIPRNPTPQGYSSRPSMNEAVSPRIPRNPTPQASVHSFDWNDPVE